MKEMYKLTEVGDIPESWEIVPLASNVGILSGFPFASDNFSETSGFPLIRIRNLLNSNTDIYFDGAFKPEYLVHRNDILIGMDGDFHIVRWRGKDALLNQRIMKLYHVEDSRIDINFLYYKLQPFLLDVHSKTSATTVKHLSTKSLVNATFAVPTSLTEQQKIAEILSTVDKKIELIDAQISHTQELKRGLKQQLLTKGIGHTQFKSSVLGDIPESWNVAELRDLLSDMKSGLSRKLSMQDIGIPVIRSNNLDAEQVTLDDLKYWYLNDPQGAKTSDYYLKDGDILISFINSLAQIGKSAMFVNKINRDIIYTTNILKLTANNTVSNHFIYYCTKTEHFKKFVQLITKPAVNQASFTTKDFQRYKIALPPLIEQEQIATILNTVDEKMNVLLVKKAEYWQLKNGLMQQLLTGKLRVDTYQEEPAVA
jgi:type I restriction enzyme S subunit